MVIDLNSLTLKELKDLNVNVQKAIVSFEERKRREALAALEATARENGFSLNELMGNGLFSQTKKTRAPAQAKFKNPKGSETWSGRGRKPQWFEAALKSGKTPQDLTL